MTYLLDTGTCSSVIRNLQPASSRAAQNAGRLHISVVAVTELEMWVVRPRVPLRHTRALFALLRTVTLLDVTEPIAHRAARVGNGLRSTGQRAELGDLLVAATALEHGLTLVTHDVQPYARIPGLVVVDWRVP